MKVMILIVQTLSTNSRNSSGFSPSTSENYSPEEARNPTGVSQLRPLNNSSPGTLQDSFLFMLLLVGLLVHCALIPLVRVGLIRLVWWLQHTSFLAIDVWTIWGRKFGEKPLDLWWNQPAVHGWQFYKKKPQAFVNVYKRPPELQQNRHALYWWQLYEKKPLVLGETNLHSTIIKFTENPLEFCETNPLNVYLWRV